MEASALPKTNGATGQPLAPPHDMEAEQAVLGSILLSDRSLYALVIGEGLRPEDFFLERHTLVFKAMLALYNESQAVDLLTVAERLERMGALERVGGRPALEELTAFVPSAANAPQYARIVRNAALLRRLLSATYGIQAELSEGGGDPRELVERAERAILEVARDDRRRDFRSLEEVLHEEVDRLHRLSQERRQLTGVPSGFADLDAITGGFQPGNLIIVAARPAMGKSALVCNIAENAAVDHKVPVALFSLEMAEAELIQRFLASQTPIPGEDLRRGRVAENRWPRILKASQRLSEAPLWIDDTSDLGLLELRAKARRLHSQLEGGLGLVIVDYLQLMRTDSRYDNRVTAVGELSRGLKLLARELEIPVIAISQLSRAVEQRPDKRPLLSDLRESGNIEQDSDLVVFLYRDDYYNEDSDRPGEADLLIAKHRNGGLGRVTLTFQRDFPKFMSYAPPQSAGGLQPASAGLPDNVVEAHFGRGDGFNEDPF